MAHLHLRRRPFSSCSRLTRDVSGMAGELLSGGLAVLSMADAQHWEAQCSWQMACIEQGVGLPWQGADRARHE